MPDSTPRPSLAKKHTPKTEANRKAPLDQGIRITYEGKQYELRAGDLTALDSQALRRELGMSFIGLTYALNSDPDIDLIAGVIWLARRVKGEPNLSYVDVASVMRYDALEQGLEFDTISDPEANPEA